MVDEISDTTKGDVLAGLAKLGPGGPVTLVVASNGYARLLDNWLCHMDALGIGRILIVAMDDALVPRLGSVKLPIARAAFDGSAEDFWLQRARIWAFLVEQGVEFIHSDIDAIWLRDPVRDYAASRFDLLVSEGTDYPDDVRAAWGFVLCTGFFWVRPSEASRRLLRAWIAPPEAILQSDDQAVLNRLLVNAGTDWMADGIESYDLHVRDRPFRCFRETLPGYCAALGLHVALLPHHLFPRLQPGAPDAIVRHVLRNERPEQRVGLLRDAGCWRLDAWPDGFAIRG